MSESEITDQELLRLIDLLDRIRGPLVQIVPGMDADAGWNVVSHLVRCQIMDKPVALTDLVQMSCLPYTTGHRRIHQMVESGLIARHPAQPGAKMHLLFPSAVLRESFERYAHQIKVLLTETTGHRVDSQSDDNYTFGGMRKGLLDVLPPATLAQPVSGSRHGLKFLFHDDNYFTSLRNWWTDFRANVGTRKDFTIVPMPQMYQTALSNSTLPQSAFDIIALNLPWLPEFASRGLISPLDDERGDQLIDPHDFHPSVWQCGSWGSRQYGVPLYITVESLAARTDLFDAANLAYPRSLKQLLAAARKLHQPKRGQFGLAWNGARGMPIASTFMFLLDAHGGSVLNGVADGRNLAGHNPTTVHTKVGLNTAAARATLRYMRKLLEVSIPDVLHSDANNGLAEFMAGRAAMGYVWTMRAARLEYDVRSKVRGVVKYLPHPNLSGLQGGSPIGGYALAVPSNLPKERAALAMQAIKWLTTSVASRTSVRNGLPVAPFFSVASDAEMAATASIATFVEQLARQDLLKTDVRPVLPTYKRIEDVLGAEIHDAMTGLKTDEEALRVAQKRIQAIVA